MGKYIKTLEFNAPYDTIQAYSIEAAESLGWNIEERNNGHITFKEKSGCLTIFFHTPTKADIKIQTTPTGETKCEIKVSNFGGGFNTLFAKQTAKDIEFFISKKLAEEIYQKLLLDKAIESGLVCPTCYRELPPGIHYRTR